MARWPLETTRLIAEATSYIATQLYCCSVQLCHFSNYFTESSFSFFLKLGKLDKEVFWIEREFQINLLRMRKKLVYQVKNLSSQSKSCVSRVTFSSCHGNVAEQMAMHAADLDSALKMAVHDKIRAFLVVFCITVLCILLFYHGILKRKTLRKIVAM